jgi:hypothetical protein
MKDSQLTDLNQNFIEELAAIGRVLNPSAEAKILARDNSALTRDLIAILSCNELIETSEKRLDYVPLLAVQLLRKMKAVESIDVMLYRLVNYVFVDELFNELIFCLTEFGFPVLEPALKVYSEIGDAKEDSFIRTVILEILSGISVRDSRIFSLLIEQLSSEAAPAADNLADYGDPAAIPYLLSAFDRCAPRRKESEWEEEDIIEIAHAIDELGGELDSKQTLIVQDVLSTRLRRSRMESKRKTGKKLSLLRPGVSIRLR